MATEKQESSVETPRRKAKRSKKTGIWNHAILAICIGAVGVLCGAGLLWWQLVIGANERHQQAQIDLINASFVGYFNGRIAELGIRVKALAEADETVAALISNDRALINQTSDALTNQLGLARRVQIFDLAGATTDSRGDVPISYAALDVIHRAQSRPFVGPEISNAQPRVVFFASPITVSGEVRGVLFVAYDRTGLFLDPLKYMDEDKSLGQITIKQAESGSEATNVFTFGDTTDGDTIYTQLHTPTWQLAFTPNLALIEPVAEPASLSSVLVIAAFFLAAISLAFSTLSRKLESDTTTLATYASQLLRGRGAKLDRYQLPMFQQLASGFAQFRTTKSSTRGTKADVSEDVVDDLLADEPEPKARKAKKQSAKQPETDPEPELELENEVDDLLSDDDEEFLEVNVADDAKENFGIEVSEDVGPVEMGLDLSPDIFRAYDIRGITTKNLTEDVVYWIGRAFAAEAKPLNQTRAVIGRDGRHSSAGLKDALARGLTEGGMDVLDVGEVPTPLLYFATHAMDTGTGIMITGSHNPPEYNGLKMVLDGVTLAEDRIQRLRKRIEDNKLTDGTGDVEVIDLNDHYVDRVLEDVVVAQPCKVVVDCGNGVAGVIAPRLIEELGCEVIPLYCDVDGDFPNHHPDPAEPGNLEDLITVVKDEKADLGLAFDGDGDRLGVVTATGEIIFPDKLLMLFAQDIVGRNPGADIIYDVKCSRHLNTLISEYGGRPIMWRTGHSHMKAKLKETGALLAGEFSGHICFGERWYGFDDALYSAARLLEIIGAENKTTDELFKQFPVTYSTPELKIETSERAKFEIVDKLAQSADFGDGTITSIDGVRVDYPDGWGLVRASNTSPVLSLRFEADGQSALDRIMGVFAEQLAAIDPSLKFG